MKLNRNYDGRILFSELYFHVTLVLKQISLPFLQHTFNRIS